MDYILIGIGIVFLIIGLLGCILPVIPGPPLSYVGLIMLQLTDKGDFSTNFLLIMAFLAVFVTVLDYIVPIWGTKRFGGSKSGVWGSTIGLIVGLFFFPPVGIILGPLVGAIIGESIRGAKFKDSLRAGMGSLLGFLLGTGIKLISSGLMTWYFFKEWIG
ncbi:MAG: DUF456 domain-containing protein [Bacteroidales bacterium]|jgi:uncharacterized protein YqgC (DUF456 family)